MTFHPQIEKFITGRKVGCVMAFVHYKYMIGGGELGGAFYYGCAFIKRKRPGALAQWKSARGWRPSL